jgi:hypothetical protein
MMTRHALRNIAILTGLTFAAMQGMKPASTDAAKINFEWGIGRKFIYDSIQGNLTYDQHGYSIIVEKGDSLASVARQVSAEYNAWVEREIGIGEIADRIQREHSADHRSHDTKRYFTKPVDDSTKEGLQDNNPFLSPEQVITLLEKYNPKIELTAIKPGDTLIFKFQQYELNSDMGP